MKNLFLGLIVGLLLASVAYYILNANMQKESYQKGYENGTKEGISMGIIQGKSEQKNYDDSLTALTQKEVSIVQTVTTPIQRKKENYNINYTMHGNEIGEEKQ